MPGFRNTAPAVIIALALLAACKPPLEQAPGDRVDSSLVIIELPKGSIAARPGSPEAALARYLASDEPAPRTFRFNATQFAPWSDKLSPETQGTLANVISILTNYPRTRLHIAGFTDNDGSAAANQLLSQQRVDALRDLMIARGISEPRIDTVGMGTADPIASNATVAGQAANRRIEMTVVTK